MLLCSFVVIKLIFQLCSTFKLSNKRQKLRIQSFLLKKWLKFIVQHIPIAGLCWMFIIQMFALCFQIRQSECKEILKFSVSNRPGTSVRCMSFSEAENQMYVVLDDGHIVVCSGMLPATFDLSYSPVQREYPCNKKPIHCIVTVKTSIR